MCYMSEVVALALHAVVSSSLCRLTPGSKYRTTSCRVQSVLNEKQTRCVQSLLSFDRQQGSIVGSLSAVHVESTGKN